MSDKLTNSGII